MSFNLSLYLDIFKYKMSGIKNPNTIKIGTTKETSHFACEGVKYKYETLP